MKKIDHSVCRLLLLTALIGSVFPCYTMAQVRQFSPTSSGKTGPPHVVVLRNLPHTQLPSTGKMVQMPDPSHYTATLLQRIQQMQIPPHWGTATPELDPSQVSARTLKGGSNHGNTVESTQSVSLGNYWNGLCCTGYTPPDPIIAAGDGYELQAVNLALVVYNSSGAQEYYATFQDFFGSLTIGLHLSDPKVLYDQYSNRWVILLLAYHDPQPGSGTYISDYLIGISETSDPTQAWYTYSISALTNNYFADFPGLGVDANAIYVTSNQWNTLNPNLTQTFQYAQLFVFNKSQFYSGQSANYYVFDDNDFVNADGTYAFTVKPAHEYGTAPGEYLLNIATLTGRKNPPLTGNFISVWTITSPLSNPVLLLQGTITVGSYANSPAVQAEGSVAINPDAASASDVVYNAGYAYTSFTTAYNWGSGTVSAIRYEKIDVNTDVADIDAVYGADLTYYFYPNIFVDAWGDIGLCFNISSSSQYIGTYYAVRTPFDSQLEGSLSHCRLGRAPIPFLEDGGGTTVGYALMEITTTSFG